MSVAEAVEASRVPEWTLGDRLKKARVLAGIEQREMARQLGVTSGAISNWEKDISRPRQDLLQVLRRWSEITNVSYGWLVGEVSGKIG